MVSSSSCDCSPALHWTPSIFQCLLCIKSSFFHSQSHSRKLGVASPSHHACDLLPGLELRRCIQIPSSASLPLLAAISSSSNPGKKHHCRYHSPFSSAELTLCISYCCSPLRRSRFSLVAREATLLIFFPAHAMYSILTAMPTTPSRRLALLHCSASPRPNRIGVAPPARERVSQVHRGLSGPLSDAGI